MVGRKRRTSDHLALQLLQPNHLISPPVERVELYMPYAVSFDNTNRAVCLEVSGKATREDHYAALEQAVRLCREHGCHRLLVDLRSLETPSSTVSSCYNFGESVAGTSPAVMIAHVLPRDAKSREDVKFVSTVEGNRGRLVGEFETVQEARAWLMGED